LSGKKSLNTKQSIEWILDGKILAHPTEAIWGLGCNALNESSYKNLFKLKNRDENKNFILLANSLKLVKEFIVPLAKQDETLLNNTWPGPVTFLIKYKDSIPIHLKNSTGKLAFRVSNHYPIKTLLKGFNGLMVSTSANISGEEVINEPSLIIKNFANDNLAYYDEILGDEAKPSTIIDLHSKEIIRP